ncbi:MAG TPA: class II fructose-bisphosphate aldolase [Pyrinomonadaceae bacterium]|nr:class II fructose-bisphosphate aldolase [Pyrinomonadaceae bacterium]
MPAADNSKMTSGNAIDKAIRCLVPSADLLRIARQQNRAVAALNFYNAETLRAHINAAAQLNASIILQTTESTINYLGIDMAVSMASAAARELDRPVSLHLDHGGSVELAKRCLEAGYRSVMIDGSKLPFAENIRVTKSVVEMARKYGASVEGELGHVTQNDDNADITAFFTRAEDAQTFVWETGVDALAVAVGTAHGFYKGEVGLDFQRLRDIRNAVGETALVLHGGSGVPAELLREAIRCGIAKINFGTELKNAFTLAVRRSLADSDDIDLRRTFAPAIKAVQIVSEEKIRVCRGA